MSENNNTNNNILEELQYIEKALKASEEYRQEAITKKDIWEKQLAEKDEELRKLGTTPEEAESEIQKIEKQIMENIETLKQMIPFDILKKKGRIE